MNKNPFALLIFTAFVLIGTHNAVVINSESNLSHTKIKFVKRADDMGLNAPAREAASIQWKKLSPVQVISKVPSFVQQSVQRVESSNAQVVDTAAAVQDELELKLSEVVNPKKWQNGLTASQFSGNLSTNNGVISELNVSLPGGDGLSVSFSEMTGNVFEYDYDGELYSGMMYQVDPSSYMVSLTNGPLEGTRLKFNAEAQVEQSQPEQPSAEVVADVGTFGQENPEAEQQVQAQEVNIETLSQNDREVQEQTARTEGFTL